MNPSTGTHFILSEEVRGYHDLPQGQAANFANGTYRGLGQVVLGSMFLQEIDLKNGNLGLDENNRVIKIDGDWCFAAEKYHYGYNLTPRAIERLPYPHDFYTFNWLDLTISSIQFPTSTIVNPELSQAPQFRAEINQAMLKICLLPDSFIDKFVDAYMPAGGQRFIDLIKARREELQLSASQNLSFQAYLQSPQAIEDRKSLCDQMLSFRANGEQLLSAEEGVKVLGDLQARVDVVEIQTILGQLSIQRNPNDHLLSQYIQTSSDKLLRNKGNPGELSRMKSELSKALEAVTSGEVIAVKAAIQKLRDEAGIFTIGKRAKADRIEHALYSIPVAERGSIISKQNPPNAVQEELASHRLWGRTGYVYKNKDNEIDDKYAAKTFKELKSQFSIAANRPETSEEDRDEQKKDPPTP